MDKSEKLFLLSRFEHILVHLPDNVRPVAIMYIDKDGSAGYGTFIENENHKRAAEVTIMLVGKNIIAGKEPDTERLGKTAQSSRL